MTSARNWVYNLLRRSEKLFKTDMIYLAKGGFWLTSGQAVSSLASFLLAIAFANLLPKENYGTYRYILSIVGILGITSVPGINVSLVRAVARGNDGTLKPAFKMRAKWAALGAATSLGLAIYYYLNNNLTLASSFAIASIFLPILDPATIYNSFLQGKKRFDLISKYTVISNLCSALGIFFTLIYTDSVLLILFVYLSINLLFRLFFLKLSTSLKKSNIVDQDTIKYGQHLSLMETISMLATYADKVLIFHYLGAVQAAIYSFALAPIDQGKGFMKSINALAAPRFAKQEKEEVKKGLLKKIFRIQVIVAPLVITYILIAPLFFKTFFPQYIDSVKFSQVYAIVIFAYAGTNLISAYFSSQRVTKEYHFVTIFSGLSRLILMFVLVLPFGVWGIIGGILISRFLTMFLSLHIVTKPT